MTALTIEEVDGLLRVCADEELVRGVVEVAFMICAGGEVNPPGLADAPVVKWAVRYCGQTAAGPEDYARILAQLQRGDPAVLPFVAEVRDSLIDCLLELRSEAASG